MAAVSTSDMVEPLAPLSVAARNSLLLFNK
jgi:hypothetical protein